MPEVAGAERQFDVVTIGAVDDMERAAVAARERVKAGGWLVTLTTDTGDGWKRFGCLEMEWDG